MKKLRIWLDDEKTMPDDFDEHLQPQYHSQTIQFWSDLQDFHDQDSNWDDKGLTIDGKLILQSLKEKYKKMNKITKAQQIKDIIKPIPADQFCIGHYENSDKSQCCVLGHIHKHFGSDAEGDGQGYGARQLSNEFLTEKHNLPFENIASVNNDTDINGYTEPVIKDRVMHLVEDMIAAGY